MKDISVIETERLILRKFTEKDIDAFFSILSDKEVNKFLPMFPLKDIEEAKQYLQERYLVSNGYHYAICFA
ncbi:GNAT family N-acetyltransferase [Clostridium botulinum]|uniref:GNAT family N-acetyltransferase n=1 Tax=Clostridium botulinum TaxID=1491 RepID=UPI000A596DFA|nr:GNAT family N-acetyltransferase [Clostridium botulinum]